MRGLITSQVPRLQHCIRHMVEAHKVFFQQQMLAIGLVWIESSGGILLILALSWSP